MKKKSRYSSVDKTMYFDRISGKLLAEVAELADALRSGRSEHYAHEGSNPSFGIFPLLESIFLADCAACFFGVIY